MKRKNSGVRASLVIALGLMMFAPMMTIVSEPAVAADTTWFCYMPSSYNSTFWQIYPKYTTGVTSCYGAQVASDGQTKDLHSTATYAYVETNDFTNPTWNDPYGGAMNFTSGDPVPDNGTATILSVSIYAKFMTWYPDMVFYFSVDDKSSWSAGHSVSAGYGTIGWNVTALTAWTPAMLNSDDTWVRLKASSMTTYNYYLDYLGFIYSYSVPWGGGYTPPEEDLPEEEDEPDWTYDLTGGGVVGVMGVVGLCGLVGTPAWIVIAWRQGEGSRIVIFVKGLVLGMFSFVMFWVSMVGG